MKRMIVLICGIAVLCFGGMVYAIDGGANLVDTISYEASSFDAGGSSAISLKGETSAIVPTEDWAVILGVIYRWVTPDFGPRQNGIGGVLGAKYYFTRMSSLALTVSHEEYDRMDVYKNVSMADLEFKQRFLGTRYGVSPYFDLAGGVRYGDYVLSINSTSSNSPNDYEVKLGVGCDFMITKTLAITFDVSYMGAFDSFSHLNAIRDSDGWIGTIGFTGYWD
jgi:hypothetical protein